VAAGAAAALIPTSAVTVKPFPATAAAVASAVSERADVSRPASRAGRRAGPLLYGPVLARRPELAAARAAPAVRSVRRTAAGHRRTHRTVVRVHPVARSRLSRAVRHRTAAARSGRLGGAGAVVAYAYAHLGAPYVYGDAGRRGFDCSGLTMRAFARAGVRLPHRAGAQSGRRVSLRAARPGDLVKWGSYHVGVYVGRGYVIHAPKPGDHVKKSRLWGSYRIVRVL